MRKSVHSKPYRALLTQLIAARKAAGLTQDELAKRLRKPQSFVAKTEKGERRLDVVEFVQIAKALRAEPGKLINAITDAL
jgi:transcriptional regulator with XRE-family HTH domain